MPALLQEIYQALKGGEQTASVKAWMEAMDKRQPKKSEPASIQE
jgi:hypothetical protein